MDKIDYTDKHLNLITSEHKIKPKFMHTLKALLDKFTDIDKLYKTFDDAFDIEFAVGKQQDIIGELVGRSRYINFDIDGESILNDDVFRVLQLAKIQINHWNGEFQTMTQIWEQLFPDTKVYIHDNQDMTMDVYVMGDIDDITYKLIAHGYVIPKPEGVRINYYFPIVTEFYHIQYVTGFFLNETTTILPEEAFEDELLSSQKAVGHFWNITTTKLSQYEQYAALQDASGAYVQDASGSDIYVKI